MNNCLFITTEVGSHKAVLPVIDKISEKIRVSYISKASTSLKNIELIELSDCLEDLYAICNTFDNIFTGTSSYSDAEHAAWQYARGNAKRSFCIIDQWKNYKERFSRNGKMLFPDIVFVIDNQAKEDMKKLGLEDERIVVSGSPYLDFIINRKNNTNRIYNFKKDYNLINKKVILFCTEYIKKAGETEKYGYDEHIILNDIVEFVKNTEDVILIIKPHPSDDAAIYDIFKMSGKVLISEQDEISDLLAISDVAIGMNSMVLTEAYIMRTPVISYQPIKNADLHKVNRCILDIKGYIKTNFTKEQLYNSINEILKGNYLFMDFYVYQNAAERITKYLFAKNEVKI